MAGDDVLHNTPTQSSPILTSRLDENNFFYELVDKEEVPNYYDVIKNPMCLRMIKERLLKYRDKEELWVWILCICVRFTFLFDCFHQKTK